MFSKWRHICINDVFHFLYFMMVYHRDTCLVVLGRDCPSQGELILKDNK